MDCSSLNCMMAATSKRKFDALVFQDLSRLTRSGVRDVLNTLGQLNAWDVKYRSLQESYIDAIRPLADIIGSLRATVAKMEQQTARVKAGLARTREQGRIGGSPCVEANPNQAADTIKLKACGHSARQIAELLEKSPTTIGSYAA
jgi:DNA invertase Pin-like site-specific DNA recombinase